MGLYDAYPYTNVHELNLRWILKQLKETREYVDNLQPHYFHNVEDMKAADLSVNDFVITFGYYEMYDGGGSCYLIVDDNSLPNDDGLVIVLANNLRAKMIPSSVITPVMFGCKGDNETDDSTHFLNCVKAFENVKIDLLYKTYKLPTLQSFTFNKNTEIVNGTLKIDNIIMRAHEGMLKLENVEIITEPFTDYGAAQKFIIFSETGDNPTVIIEKCKLISNKTSEYNNIVCLVYLKDYYDVVIKDSVIKNNNANTTAGGCVWISAKSLTRNNVIITGNDIYNSSIDEAVGLYDTKAGNYTEVSNNYIVSDNNPNYANTLYGVVSKVTKIINNTIKSNTHEYAIYSITNTNPVYVNDNVFIHDASLQDAANKSGLYSNYAQLNADRNIFRAVNCSGVSYNIQPVNISNVSSISDWIISFDASDTHNSVGIITSFNNCVFNEVYKIMRILRNCTVNTSVGVLGGNLQAYDCVFNMAAGASGGYATGDVIFKNCSGGTFGNSQQVANLIIENSSVDYAYGALTNYTINQSRLDYAAAAGHIFNSIMNNAVVTNLTRT